ncbi:thioesterase II family protein [Streptomyces sp. NPDC087851]|uniref:thioesterase II family protein n=1 Tax=Streptomyces sp. NPDC087851 TaxID=3365810 RepID=UPI0037F79128
MPGDWFPRRGRPGPPAASGVRSSAHAPPELPPAVRLFCFPHAGAGAAAYGRWARAAPPGVEIRGVELPGRGSRFGEPPRRRLHEAVDALTAELPPLLDAPYVLQGHSMGALLAFETARRLRVLGERDGTRQPSGLVVSGMPAPPQWPNRPPLHRLGRSALVLRETELGIPAEVREDTDLLDLLLPALLADLELTETYRYRPPAEGRPLNLPLTVLTATRDPRAPARGAAAWAAMTEGALDIRTFEGGHFFLHEHDGVLGAVLATPGLAEAGRSPSPGER